MERAIGGADLGFGAIVVLTTVATLMPRLIAGVGVDERSFGPFTPGLEKTLGRVAMLVSGPPCITARVRRLGSILAIFLS